MTVVHTTTRDIILPDPIDPNHRQGNTMSENTERDEQAGPPYLVGVTDDFPGGNDDDLTEWAFERGIEYQKWHSKPRQVSTAADLNKLRTGAIVRDVEGDAWQRMPSGAWWCADQVNGDLSGYLPATVLHEPEATL